ncbi:MAG: glycosyltransferase, partial [Patescibacteria group bacterium]
ETSRKFFPKGKIVLTGNPVRQMANGTHSANSGQEWQMANDEKFPLIYVTGGSSGSHFINALVENNLTKILEKFNVIHQTGESFKYNDFSRLGKIKASLPKKLQGRYILTKFIDPSLVGSILEKADIVISRSGINTVTELIFFGVPSLLIPLPFSQRQEQLKNALFLKTKGCAEIFEQKDDSAKQNIFLSKLFDIFENINKYRENLQKISKLVNTDAARKIIDVLEYAKKKK